MTMYNSYGFNVNMSNEMYNLANSGPMNNSGHKYSQLLDVLGGACGTSSTTEQTAMHSETPMDQELNHYGYRRSSLYGPLPTTSPSAALYNDVNSSLDTHLLHLLSSLGQTQQPHQPDSTSYAQDACDLLQDKCLSKNVEHSFSGVSLNDRLQQHQHNPSQQQFTQQPLYQQQQNHPSQQSNYDAAYGSESSAAIAAAKRFSLLATTQNHSRRASLGVSLEDIEKILNMDTQSNPDVDPTPIKSNRSSYANFASKTGASAHLPYSPSIGSNCESLARTLSMHLLDLSNYGKSNANEERGNASFAGASSSVDPENQYRPNSMTDANLHLLKLFSKQQKASTAHCNDFNPKKLQQPDHSESSSMVYNNSTPEVQTSLSSSTGQPLTTNYQPQQREKSRSPQINPLDTESPFYSATFAQEYKGALESLVQKMNQSSQSRKGFEEVKRQLNQMNKMQDLHDSSSKNLPPYSSSTTFTMPSTSKNTCNISYADIKAKRRCTKSVKKTTSSFSNRSKSNHPVNKKKQYTKFTNQHRRSLSLKCFTPETIFGC